MLNKHKDSISKWTVIVATIISVCSLVFGLYTYRKNLEFQKEVMTNQIFTDYSKLCLQYPEYADGIDTSVIKGSNQLSKYYNFADLGLYSCETILSLNEGDSAWIGTVQSIIEDHKYYILSNDFPWANYSDVMDSLIVQTLPELKKK